MVLLVPLVVKEVPLPKTISKSRYLAGLQCPKRLWLEIHRYDLKDEVDQDTQAVFDRGQAVGELAQLLYRLPRPIPIGDGPSRVHSLQIQWAFGPMGYGNCVAARSIPLFY